MLYGRIGLCTQEFGTLASWLVDVVNLLRGRLDAEGGAMFPRPATGQGEASDSVGELLRGRWHSKVRGFPEYMSMLPATLMAEELAWDGPDRARALITVAGNPVLSVPNGDRLREAMDGLDFVVALDVYINETTSRADVILPSTVQLEHSNYDFLFQSTSVRNFARYSPRVLAPEPGARDQWQLMLEICGRVNGISVAQLDEMIFDGPRRAPRRRAARHRGRAHQGAGRPRARSRAPARPDAARRPLWRPLRRWGGPHARAREGRRARHRSRPADAGPAARHPAHRGQAHPAVASAARGGSAAPARAVARRAASRDCC